MFTGLVETIGTVSSLSPLDASVSGGNGTSLTISNCTPILDATTELGDSISVNGTCLTITEFSASTTESSASPFFKVGVAPETLRRTNLGSLVSGSRVNLERAVLASTRMGGHFVQGHVDTVARIAERRGDGNAVSFRLVPRDGAKTLRYVVEKGYVTLDGASLTVTGVSDPGEKEGWFEVMLIAYTQERVVMGGKGVGEEVNVEIDVVGKMVEKSVAGYFEELERRGGGDEQKANGSSHGPGVLEAMVGRMVEEKLRQIQGGGAAKG